MRRFPEIIMLLALTVMVMALLTGCKAKPVADVDQTRPLTGIASAVARADVRADTIIDLAAECKKFGIDDFATMVARQAAGIKADVVTVNRQLNEATDAAATAQDQLREANTIIVQTQTALDAERDHWLGHKTRVLVTWIVAGLVTAWAVLGTLAVVLSIASPTGAGLIWGKRIIRFLPLANPFSWLRDRAITGAGSQ